MTFRPATFGKYVLLKRIAIGGMAEVFRAKAFGAEGFEKLAAVKRMLAHLSSDNQFVGMFINEAKLAANLNHANIVQIYDFGCIENLYFISMEYVHGKDIADIIRILRDRNLSAPLELACHILIEVLNGLDYAHRLSDPYGTPLDLIHRDMSPHNIIISYEGEVKIADFGIAKATSTTVHTTGGVLKGKYSYMSPEQAQGKSLDHRSDVFSLAICFYELLTLTKMFHAENDLSVLEMVRETNFIRPRDLNDSIPEELEDILLKALEKNPEDRYATAGEMRDELERFLFSSNLHFSTAWLAGFMREIFRDELDREKEELAEEHEVTQKLRSEARRAARIEEATIAGSDTVVVKRGSEPSEPNVPSLVAYGDQGDEEYTNDTVQGKTSQPGGLIVVDNDQLMEMDDVEEIDSLEELDDETLLETHRFERPDPALFGEPPARMAKIRRRPPIREVAGPRSRDKEDAIDSLMDSAGSSGEMAAAPLVAAEFDMDRSTIPEPGKRSPISSGPTDIEDNTMQGSSQKGFPFGVLFVVLLVAVVGGGIAAFFFHSGNAQKSKEDDGANPARLDVESKMELKAAIEKETASAGLTDRSELKEEIASLPSSRTPREPAGEAEPREEKKEAPKVAAAPMVEKKSPPPPEPKVEPAPEKRALPPRHRPKSKTGKWKKRRKKPVASAPEEKGFGKLDVGVSDSWAFVYIDGAKIRTTPLLNYQIKAGRHKVELRDSEGQVIRRWRIRLRANERVKLLHQ